MVRGVAFFSILYIMSPMLTIKVEKRDLKEKLDLLRENKRIPAVYYGSKTASTPISLDLREFSKVLKEAGETTIISLETDGGVLETLIHDVQIDPVNNLPIHVDFYVVEKGQKVEVDIPIEFEGVAPAVKNKGGVLVKVTHHITVSADPNNIPHEIIVDISGLEDFDSQIFIRDIVLPPGVVAVTDESEMVASVAAPQEEEAEEGATEMDMDAIEVEKKGKREEEGDEE